MSPQSDCACVHPHATDCAMIRDGFNLDDEHYYRRKCECVCHKEFEKEDEE